MYLGDQTKLYILKDEVVNGKNIYHLIYMMIHVIMLQEIYILMTGMVGGNLVDGLI